MKRKLESVRQQTRQQMLASVRQRAQRDGVLAAKPVAPPIVPPMKRKYNARPAGVLPQHAVSAASLANLRKGKRETDIPKETPVLTADRAAEYVKLRAAGLPPIDAILYFAKGAYYGNLRLKRWANLWEHAAATTAAWDVWNGGAWQDLDATKRLELARDHHLAQLAYCLYTSDFNAADANLRKLAEAREAVTLALSAEQGGDSSRFEAFMRDLVSRSGDIGPPIMQATMQVEQIGANQAKES